MHPALSVILFTTLSGAGYGLLAWTGLSLLMFASGGEVTPAMRTLTLWSVGVGMALVTAGFLSSLAHLGKPMRTWRALGQWRSSWMSREGVLAIVCYLPALALFALAWLSPNPAIQGWMLMAAGLATTTLALATVWATGMIYATLRTIPAWAMSSVPLIYLMFALGTGMALLFTLASAHLALGQAITMGAVLLAQGVMLALIKWMYWREIDRQPLGQTRGDAVGLPEREIEVVERPHTEANYITREMAFVLARQHGTALRWLATALLVAGPLLAVVLGALGTPAAGALAVAMVLMLGGAFVERWLFFAQARHLVTLYY